MPSEPPSTLAEREPGGSPSPRPKARRSLAWWFGLAPPPDPQTRPVVSTAEVFALLEYAANKGIQRGKIEALSAEIHKDTPDPSAVAGLYADLVADTKPVTGRSLVDSRTEGFRRLAGISTVTAIFFVLAVGNFVVDAWVADIVEPEEGRFWLGLKRYVWDYLTPFFWGGLGACVFLLKRVQDAAQASTYEHHLMQNWLTRVLIGGVLAAIVLIIFDPSAFTPDALPLRPAAIAFLTGLGVKAVYGGLERLIDEIAQRFKVESLAQRRAAGGGDGG